MLNKNKIWGLFKKTLKLLAIATILSIIFVLTPILIWGPKKYELNGFSMFPSIKHNDHCLVITKSYNIDRGDIIIFKNVIGKLCKRIIGLPGDTIKIKRGYVYVNNNIYPESYILFWSTETLSQQFILLEDEYYVLGDLRFNSLDSRMFGPIEKEDILGKVVLRWTPLLLKRY
jgi:signal peptidase I